MRLSGLMPYNGHEPVTGNIVIGNTAAAPSWIFANTGLSSGSVLTGLLGYEVDEEEGDQPANTIVLGLRHYTFTDGMTYYGDMTVYQAASGAWVFSPGTVQGLRAIATAPTLRVRPVRWSIRPRSRYPRTCWRSSFPSCCHSDREWRRPLPPLPNSSGPTATPTPGVVQITAPLNNATVSEPSV